MNPKLFALVLAAAIAPLSLTAEPEKPAPARAAVNAGGGVWGMPGAPTASAYLVFINLGELNMKPDFTLTADQKEKLQAIRDEVQQKQEKWRTDRAEDFKKIQEKMLALRGQNNPDAWKEINAAQTALRETMPKEDEAVERIKALLTPEQLKMLTAKESDNRARMGRNMRDAQRGQKNPNPAPNPAPAK